MRPGTSIRMLIAFVGTVLIAAVLVALLVATDTVLSIWSRLSDLAPWAVGLYLAVLAAVAALMGWFVLRLLLARPRRERSSGPPDRDSLERRLERDEEQGIATGGARSELAELDRRREEQQLYLVMFGEVSVGKSALINALLPDARQETAPIGGTTREIRVFRWAPEDSIPVQLVDVPGFGHDETRHLAELARDEALRAHVVIYVAEGDLNRRQHEALRTLTAFDKPIIVAINKADRYSEEELDAIRDRLLETLPADTAIDVVAVSAGGHEEVVVADTHGQERVEQRPRPARIEPLVARITRIVDGERASLSGRQEQAALRLAAAKLDRAERYYRKRAAERLVEKYSRRAVIGALAAITPGSDLVIQGALATKLMHDLCKLYDTSVREMDLDRFLALAGGRVRRTTAVILAVAGNGLKAFPGVGTIAGGLVHAVAYGMIFDSLGRAAAEALDRHGTIEPEKLAERFEDRLLEDTARRSTHFARLALRHLKERERHE